MDGLKGHSSTVSSVKVSSSALFVYQLSYLMPGVLPVFLVSCLCSRHPISPPDSLLVYQAPYLSARYPSIYQVSYLMPGVLTLWPLSYLCTRHLISLPDALLVYQVFHLSASCPTIYQLSYLSTRCPISLLGVLLVCQGSYLSARCPTHLLGFQTVYSYLPTVPVTSLLHTKICDHPPCLGFFLLPEALLP